jgi:hypothetical protein
MPQRNPEVGENLHDPSRRVGLPMRPFLYTLDQISTLLEIDQRTLKLHYIFYEGLQVCQTRTC